LWLSGVKYELCTGAPVILRWSAYSPDYAVCVAVDVACRLESLASRSGEEARVFRKTILNSKPKVSVGWSYQMAPFGRMKRVSSTVLHHGWRRSYRTGKWWCLYAMCSESKGFGNMHVGPRPAWILVPTNFCSKVTAVVSIYEMRTQHLRSLHRFTDSGSATRTCNN